MPQGCRDFGGTTIRSERSRVYLLGLATIIVVAVVFTAMDPFPQPAWYHRFVDQREMFHIPNAMNVISNLPFLVVGLGGTPTAFHRLERRADDLSTRIYGMIRLARKNQSHGGGYCFSESCPPNCDQERCTFFFRISSNPVRANR